MSAEAATRHFDVVDVTRRFLRTLLVPFLALVSALFIGALVIVFSDPDTLDAWGAFFNNPGKALEASWELTYDSYFALFESSLGSTSALSETIVQATPLMLAGLSVALAFRAGLFNIGAEGQLLIGSLAAAYVGFTYDLPAVIHLPFALLAGFAGGALWGGIAGILKARTGAHEVITTIMLNFIALRLADYLLLTDTYLRPGRTDPISKPVAESAELPGLGGDLRIHAGIIVALVAAYAVWWLLFRSTIGFRFRAVGANPSAGAYAGMGVGGTYILAMVLAGGLSGLAGTSTLLGVRKSLTGGFAGFGFDAIALALLGRTHPAGVIAASLLFGILRAGATGMQIATSTPVDIIIVIQALIIAFMAAPALIRAVYRIRAERIAGPEDFSKTWAT